VKTYVRRWYSSDGDSIQIEENISDKKKSQYDPIPETKLREYFPRMQNSEVPLLTDVEAYLKSLPRRERKERKGGAVVLYSCPYWVNEDDLSTMANQLEMDPVDRDRVKYVVAPARSGKSASILPAFLQTTGNPNGFTHYFYLAFNNNAGNFYVPSTCDFSNDNKIAERQGGAFIVECVKHLLESPIYFAKPGEPSGRRIALERSPKVEDTQGADPYVVELKEYFTRKFGKSARILIHVDEHRKMSESPQFRKGALETLPKIDNVTVVATYTEQPDLPPDQSSTVCRLPVNLPVFDIRRAMNDIPDLNFPESDLKTRTQKRQFATMLFKLAVKITLFGLTDLHTEIKSKAFSKFLSDFKIAVENNKSNVDGALLECNELCSIGTNDLIVVDSENHAQDLLLGISKRLKKYFPDKFHLVVL